MDSENDKDNTSSIVRRQFERYRIECPVEIRLDNNDSKATTCLMDISMGGASIKTVNHIVKDENLLMCLDDGNTPFEGYGQVVWTKKSEVGQQTGIKFLYMTDASLSNLSRILISKRSIK